MEKSHLFLYLQEKYSGGEAKHDVVVVPFFCFFLFVNPSLAWPTLRQVTRSARPE